MIVDVIFPTALSKARYLDGAASDDARSPEVLAFVAPLRGLPPRAQAAELHRRIRDGVRYTRDRNPITGERCEDLACAAIVLRRRRDDCDGKARLFVAAARAVGLVARIVAVMPDDDDFQHVQAEVELDGRCCRVELTLAGVELGEGSEAARLDAAGEPVYA